MKNKTLKYHSLKLLTLLFLTFFSNTKSIARTISYGNNSLISDADFIKNFESIIKDTIKLHTQVLDFSPFEEKENFITSHKNIFQFFKRKTHRNSNKNIYIILNSFSKRLFIFILSFKTLKIILQNLTS